MRKPAGENMSRVDTAWLRMDSASNLMMIVGVWTLRPAIGYEALCRRVEERMLKYDRFRQRVVEGAAAARWVEHPVDIHQHVLRERLPPHRPGDEQKVLQERVGELAILPLHRDRPLWQMHLIEGLAGASVLVFRIHHCIADGIALMQVTLSLVDGGAPPPQRRRLPRSDEAAPELEAWLSDHLVRPLAGAAIKALEATGEGAARSIASLLMNPDKRVSVQLAQAGYRLVSDALALLLMPNDSPTRLKGKPGNVKHVAWCPPLPLDEVKAIGNALGCSINDVLLSCVAGSLRQYLRSRHDEVDGLEIRAMVPVNLRSAEGAHHLGNHFGLVPLLLPVGIANPIERLYEVRRRMNALKGSTQPVLAFAVLAIAGLVVRPAQDAILDLFRHKATAVMTNLPGPREKMKLLGATVDQVMFWVPQSGDIGLGISVLSYGGDVQFGVVSDTLLCPDPQAIVDQFAPEFEKLTLLTLMLPWE